MPRIGNYQLQGSINDLEISYICVHVYEMVYSNLCYIIWKKPAFYHCIVILICGFHQLSVKQRIIYKRSSCIGVKEWCFGAGVKHSLRLHKQWKWIITTNGCTYTKNVSIHWFNSDLRKWKVSYFFQSFGQA